MRKALTIILIIAAVALGEVAVQTDWSGGPGVDGPVADWGDQFDTSSDIDWSSQAGSILLEAILLDEPAENLITDQIANAFRTRSVDLDFDGDIDVLLITDYSGTDSDEVSWWENLDGAGTAWEQHVLTSTFPDAQDINCGDIDGDDDLDILTTGWESSYLSWWENVDLENDNWVEHVIDLDGDPVTNPIGSELAYLDTDGDLDIVLSDLEHGNSNVMFIENDDYGADWLKNTIDGWYNSPWYPRVGDLDDDGFPDLAACSIGYDDVYWWRNEDGYGTFGSAQIISDGELDDPKQIELADLDDDDDLDVIVGSAEDGVYWWANDGSGGGWNITTVTEILGSRSLEALDIDGDGDVDLLFSTEGGEVYWFENADGAGGSWNEHLVDEHVPNCRWAEGADINDDGHPDVVSACKTDSAVYWWQLTGFSSGNLTSSILDTGFESAFSYGLLSWDAVLPDDCSLAARVRSSDDDGDLGDWSEPITVSGTDVSDYLTEEGRYFQYRIEFGGTDPNQTPILESIEISYGSDEVAPVIDHEAVTEGVLDTAVDISAEISDNNEVVLARVFYRRGGDTEFSYTDLTLDSGETYTGSIPAAFVTERGLDYYLWASDGINSVSLPVDGPEDPFNIAVTYAGEGIDPGSPQHAGDGVDDYRLFSVPTDYGADGGSPAGVLEDDLGAYDDSAWRLARYQDGGFVEYTRGSIEYFKPGRAYWLIVAESGIVLDSGEGRSPDCSEPYGIDLQAGWNQLACPYAFAVDWSAVTGADDNAGIIDRLEDPVGYEGSYDYTVETLEPWKGYFVYLSGSGAATLYVPPVESDVSGLLDEPPPAARTGPVARRVAAYLPPVAELSSASASAAPVSISPTAVRSTAGNGSVSGASAVTNDVGSSSAPRGTTADGPVAEAVEPLWWLELGLDSGGLLDAWNRVGVAAGAGNYWDRAERRQPPYLSGAPDLYLDHSDWPDRRGRYATDYRPEVGEGLEFELVVQPAAGAETALVYWSGLENLPPGVGAVLLDDADGARRELTPGGDYLIELLPGEVERRLTLLVGYADWLQDQTPATPRSLYLAQSYPNPSPGPLTIEFGVDESGPVELAVYDLAGRRVATLVDGELSAGHRSIAWDGATADGRAVPSGVYLYRLSTRDDAVTRRLIISR